MSKQESVLFQVEQFELAATMTIPYQVKETGLSLESPVENDPVPLPTRSAVIGDQSGHGKL